MILICIFGNNPLKRKRIKQFKSKEDLINSYIVQGISNVDTVKGSHLEKRLIDKFELNYKSYQESIYQYENQIEIENYIKENIKSILLVFFYSIAATSIIEKEISLSNIIAFQSLFSYLNSSIQNIFYSISNYHNYKIALDRVEELFLIEKESFKNNYYYLPYKLKGTIEYKNLNYHYGSKELFKNLNLKIEPGEKILLSGESGSGKSTLVKMLMRYIETEYSTIKIAGIDINHYHLQNIRENIVYVTSHEYLFHDSIRNNISLYQEYDEEEIEKVYKICNVDQVRELDYMIEEDGFNISNGERQRIILARSLLKKRNIYIFDEAFGQIDIEKEKRILENIFQYLKEQTIIVISHRFNNKKLFDRVLKLENGMIYENKKI